MRRDRMRRLLDRACAASWAIDIRIDIPIVSTRLGRDVNRIVSRQLSIKIGVGVRRGELLTVDGYIGGVRGVQLQQLLHWQAEIWHP